MFKRPYHQRIAQALSALNGPLLKEHNCLFGGGTVIAMLYGEYRESVDIDFLVSDVASYRELRQLLTGAGGIATVLRGDAEPLKQLREMRADQYGIRTILQVNEMPIKFEIVLEGRIELASPDPSKLLCGIATLTPLDMATSKLLANSDRWAEEGVFNLKTSVDCDKLTAKPGLTRGLPSPQPSPTGRGGLHPSPRGRRAGDEGLRHWHYIQLRF